MLFDLPMKLSKKPLNAYDIHCMVYDAMLDDPEKNDRDFLFTVLPDLGGMVVIRSAAIPDSLRPCAMPVAMPSEGELRTFELVAAPMRKLPTGRREPFPKDDSAARMEWLARMGDRHGFEVIHGTVFSAPVHYDRKGAKFSLDRAVFHGELIVKDAEKMSSALARGIGRARSLGHGMLRWV